MNYYQALESKKGGWHYCCHNDNIGTFPVGYCHAHEPHETELEARECYTKYLIDSTLHLNIESQDSQHKCMVCGEWTNLSARVDHSPIYHLCSKHNNRDEVAKLFPTISLIISSW